MDYAADGAMSNKPTGGPAFPVHPEMPIETTGAGMSLRDYFAAKVMQAVIQTMKPDGSSDLDAFTLYARASYQMADAMLEARKS